MISLKKLFTAPKNLLVMDSFTPYISRAYAIASVPVDLAYRLLALLWSVLWLFLRLLYYPTLALLLSLLLMVAVGGARAYIESSHVKPEARERLQECTQHLFADPQARPPLSQQPPSSQLTASRLSPSSLFSTLWRALAALLLLALAALVYRQGMPPWRVASLGVAWALPQWPALGSLRWEARALCLCLLVAACDLGARRLRAAGTPLPCPCQARAAAPPAAAKALAPLLQPASTPAKGQQPAGSTVSPAAATAAVAAVPASQTPHTEALGDAESVRAAAAAERAAERAARRVSMLHSVAHHAQIAHTEVAQATPLAGLLGR